MVTCTAGGVAANGTWSGDDPAVTAALAAFEAGRGFAVDISHLTLSGRCAACRAGADA